MSRDRAPARRSPSRNRTRERHLEHLAEDVYAEAHDDHRGDADAARADLDRLEDEQQTDGNHHGEPRDQAVDGAPDERGHADAEHADQAEEPDY